MFFTGTDSLMLIDVSRRKFKKKIYWLAFRLLIKIADYFVDEYYCDDENIADNLRQFGISKRISLFRDKLLHTDKYPKKKHTGFNIIYYLPKSIMEKSFNEWLYGYDIYLTIVQYYEDNPKINFHLLRGDSDMKNTYPVTDFYLRPNRHDGASRIRQECEIQGIPYYWSKTNPSINEAIKAIENEYKRKTKL